MFEFNYKTTFWTDFSIADHFGSDAINGTYKRAFREWKSNTEYITELVIVLNHKIWQHYENGNDAFAKLYDKLWKQADAWCLENLTGSDLRYYLETTD